MKPCPSCNRRLAPNAQQCPGCGRQFTSPIGLFVFWVIATPFILMIMYGIAHWIVGFMA